ncbi:MAG: hypothetical protein AAF961_02585, partial [Planctomycetota bacterium]
QATVEVESFGDRRWNDVPVSLLVDGSLRERQSIDAAGGGRISATFPLRLIEPGDHILEFRVDAPEDGLTIDNRRWAAIDLPEATRVACFADDPRDAAEIIRALRPDPTTIGGIVAESFLTSRLDATPLDEYSAVWLCNVAKLAPRESRIVGRYVKSGGALVIQMGDRVQPDNYNEWIGPYKAPSENSTDERPREAGAPLLPLRIDAAARRGDWRIDPLGHQHTVTAPFRGRERAGLAGVRVNAYFPVEMQSESTPVEIALAVETGDAALLLADCGLGRAALLTTSPALPRGDRTPWSNMAISPSFLPLVRQLLESVTMSRRKGLQNRLVGQSLSTPASNSTAALQWRTPQGDVLPATVFHDVDAPMVMLEAADVSGVYLLESSAANQPDPVGPPRRFAVNVDTRESDLAAVDIDQLREKLSDRSATSLAVGRAERQLGPILFAFALALMFVELAAGWLFGRGAT